MKQVFLKVWHGAGYLAEFCLCQTAVAVFGPRLGLQHDQAVSHRNQTLPVFLRFVNFFQIAQHAADDFAWRCGLQVHANRRVLRVLAVAQLAKRLQALGQLFSAQRLAAERVNHHLTFGQIDFDHEVARSKLFSQLEQAGVQMMEALSYPLQVEKDFFTKMVVEGNSILRLLHYPPIPEGVDTRCIRAAEHEDINFITILPAATTSGLQLKDRDGTWLDIECDYGTLIVDAGDMLARITNDVIPSTTHRVINPQDGKNNSRYSMPFFMHPHPESVLSCLPSCRGTGAKYPDILSHEFLMQRLREIGLVK